MRTIEALLESPAVERIGWALLHSLWESTVVAVLLAMMLRRLPSAPAEYRYLAACVALVMMVVLPAATSGFLAPAPDPVGAAGTQAPARRSGATGGLVREAVTHGPRSSPQADWLTRPKLARSWPQPWPRTLLGWMAAAWMAGVTALTLRLLGGWLVVRRLARRARPLVGPCDEALRRLARTLRVRREVRLGESSLVRVPMVIGGLRPMILLPLAVLTGLPPGQLEAILAHELAHIRRHDYVINLVQCALEVLLFYHPAAWWAARMIRAEREHCCDDLAVRVCGDRLTYARALAAIEGLRCAPRLSLSLAASDGPLLARVRRILTPEAPSMDRLPVLAPGAALLIGVLLLSAATAQIPQPEQPPRPAPEVAAPDANPAPDQAERPRGGREPLVRKVYLPIFRSESFPRYVSLCLTEAVIQELEERTKCKVVGTPEEANTTLEGTVNVEDKDLMVENLLNLPRRFSAQVVATVRWVSHPRVGSERKEAPSTFRAQLTFNLEAGETPKAALFSMCQDLAAQVVKQMDRPEDSPPAAPGRVPVALPLMPGAGPAMPIRDASVPATETNDPRLRVEQTATPGKVLKGQQVQFKIAISNAGKGPIRNVSVQMKLSPGMRHASPDSNDKNLLEQTLDRIEPGQQFVLDPIVADTLAAGEQTCLVLARSTDLAIYGNGDGAGSMARVTVIEPRLKLVITGDHQRFTDTIATYNVTVENPGTATVHHVEVLAALPLSGRLIGPPPFDTRWDAASGKLIWSIPQVEPGEKERKSLRFQVRMGGVGIYPVTVEARADGGLSDRATHRTNVSGLADLEFEVLEQRRVVDLNDTTLFTIRIKNIGTKDATHILVRAQLSNVEPMETRNGTDDRSQAQYNPVQRQLVFPPIDRLGPSKEIVMAIKVRATGKGRGTCRVFLMHDELNLDERLEDMAIFRITAASERR